MKRAVTGTVNGVGLSPVGDPAGSPEYRLHLVKVLTQRALEQAAPA